MLCYHTVLSLIDIPLNVECGLKPTGLALYDISYNILKLKLSAAACLWILSTHPSE